VQHRQAPAAPIGGGPEDSPASTAGRETVVVDATTVGGAIEVPAVSRTSPA
jgi:hypothetical protein